MKHHNQKGMRLKCRGQAGWFLDALAAFLGSVALSFSFAGFPEGMSPALVLAVGGCISLFYGLLMRKNRQEWFFPSVLAVLLVISLFYRNQVWEGARLLWNMVSRCRLLGTGMLLPNVTTELPEEQQRGCLLLITVVFSCVCTLLAFLLAQKARAMLAIVPPIILLSGAILLGWTPSILYWLIVLGTSVLLLGLDGKEGPITGKLLVCGVGICIALAVALLPASRSWAESVGIAVQQGLHEARYETAYTTLPEGDFSDYQQGQEHQTALIVTMQLPEPMYLRGFTGAVFDDEQWLALENESLAEHKDLLYWLNLNAFHSASQFQAAAWKADLKPNSISIQNIGACSRYRYVPFSLCEGSYLSPEDLRCDGLAADGERTYFYTALFAGGHAVTQVLEQLQASDDSDLLAYRQAERVYRDFVYAHYLQVPEEIETMLADEWNAVGTPTTKEAGATLALTFLNRCFPKEGTPETMDLPLRMAKGTSYQYATVAVMTLRHFGIPARYAEGYVITEEMAKRAMPEESIEVTSGNGGAWAEVYQDGIGWIPMAMTPGGDVLAQNLDNGLNGRNSTESKIKEGKAYEPPPADKQESPEPDGGAMVKLEEGFLWGLVLLLGFLLLLLLALLIRRKLVLSAKERRFRGENRKEAVAWIFADTALLLEKLGFQRGNGSMRALCETVAQTYGAPFAERFQVSLDLNDMALFSSHPLSEEQHERMLQFHRETQLQLHSEASWSKRLWMKWIQCLY